MRPLPFGIAKLLSHKTAILFGCDAMRSYRQTENYERRGRVKMASRYAQTTTATHHPVKTPRPDNN